MAPVANTTEPPVGHPAIPPGIPQNNIVAIITVHHDEAPNANRTTQHDKLNTTTDGIRALRQRADGVHIFLRRLGPHGGQHCFNFGRERKSNMKPNKDRDNLDVYLPGPAKAVGVRQFSLVPVWEHNCWRLQSTSEYIATVNHAPIQVCTARTKNQAHPLPQAVYLRQSEVNHVVINDMRIDIWLMKSVRRAYVQQEFSPPALDPQIQNVADRPEPWALERWNLTEEQVSRRTFRVIHRFTGEKETAKLFRYEQRQRQLRDREFLMFKKQEVDASVVRYLHATEFSTVPAIITDSHEGLVTYASVRDEIRRLHPGRRFEIATKLTRRLYHAVDFMHFHGILHRGISNESVLIQLVDGKIIRVLLVDYSTTRPFPSGEPLPVERILEDSQSVMEVIEDCCDIWVFRNGPTGNAQGNYLMQQRTTELHGKWMMIKRVSADFLHAQRGDPASAKGQKLVRLQNKFGNDWKSARAAQVENCRLREIRDMSKSKINAKLVEWNNANPAATGIEQQDYMLLSLGHSYLDSLPNQLHIKRWNTTAHEICTKFREFGGDLEDPWQTFEVQKATRLVPAVTGYTKDSVMTWLATCCEVHPEWRQAIGDEVDHHVQAYAKFISRAIIGALYAALQGRGRLPATMIAIFDCLMGPDSIPVPMEETYHIWYHVSSRLFNLTQLHRLATPERLQTVISDKQIYCDNFVEVRGDSRIQGCYASLSLLGAFCDVLGLELPQPPDLTIMPTLDPSDFSEVQAGRIVLARPGMLGYASMTRSADQVNWLNPKAPVTFETSTAFIPTNFGDMKVIPELPYGRIHERPAHWSKYKTAEETEALSNPNKRRFLPIRSPSQGLATRVEVHAMDVNGDLNMNVLPADAAPVQETAITKLLRAREAVRAAAQISPKRFSSPDSSRAASSKRIQTLNRPSVTNSFVQNVDNYAQGRAQPSQHCLSGLKMALGDNIFMGRNSAMPVEPPDDPTNVNQSFTVADDDETLEEDWKIVDAMLKELPEDEDHTPDISIFGFNLDAVYNEPSHENNTDPPAREDDEVTEVDDDSFAEKQYQAGNHGGAGGKDKVQSEEIASLLATSMTPSFSPQQQRARGHSRSQIPSHLGQQFFDARAITPRHKRNQSSVSDIAMGSDGPVLPQMSPSTSPNDIGIFGGLGHGNIVPTPDSQTRQQRPRSFGNPTTGLGFDVSSRRPTSFSFNGTPRASYDLTARAIVTPGSGFTAQQSATLHGHRLSSLPPTATESFGPMPTRMQSTAPARPRSANVFDQAPLLSLFAPQTTRNIFGRSRATIRPNTNPFAALARRDPNHLVGSGDVHGVRPKTADVNIPNTDSGLSHGGSQSNHGSGNGVTGEKTPSCGKTANRPLSTISTHRHSSQDADLDMPDTDTESFRGGSTGKL